MKNPTKTELRVKLTIMIEPDLLERAKLGAKQNYCTLSAYVRQLIDRDAPKMKKKKPALET